MKLSNCANETHSWRMIGMVKKKLFVFAVSRIRFGSKSELLALFSKKSDAYEYLGGLKYVSAEVSRELVK